MNIDEILEKKKQENASSNITKRGKFRNMYIINFFSYPN